MTALTNEQTIPWTLECDLIDSRDIKEEFAQSILAKLREFAALAYAAGQAAEREGLAQQEICKLSLLADVSRRCVELGQKLEREACAKTCEDYADITPDHDARHAYRCAYLIRKRGENENLS